MRFTVRYTDRRGEGGVSAAPRLAAPGVQVSQSCGLLRPFVSGAQYGPPGGAWA